MLRWRRSVEFAWAFCQGQDDQRDCPESEDIPEYGSQGAAVQPQPKLGRCTAEIDELLASNAAKAARERLTLIRLF